MHTAAPKSSDLPTVKLFTDGGCLGNPGPGGWGFILRHPASGKQLEKSGGDDHTTNNRMELTAVIEGLAALSETSRVELVADSQYVLHGIRDWLPGWKKRNWRKADKKPVLNVELWQRLDALLQKHEVVVEWTKGHAGHAENEKCDRMATREAEQRRKHKQERNLGL